MGEFDDLNFDDAMYENYDQYPDDEVVCKYCGKENLSWYEVKKGTWRLFDSKFKEHNCRRVSEKTIAAGFGDETCAVGSAVTTGATKTVAQPRSSTTVTRRASVSGKSTNNSPKPKSTRSPKRSSTGSGKKAGKTAPSRSRSKR